MIATELEKPSALKDRGELSQHEFEKAKELLLLEAETESSSAEKEKGG